MMPFTIRERDWDHNERARAGGLVEGRAEPSIGHYAKFPRIAASVDAAVIRRGIRRPPEPTGDREVRGRYGNRGSRDSISKRSEERRVGKESRSRWSPDH